MWNIEKPLFRYLILEEDCTVCGTNNKEHAVECAYTHMVWDVVTGAYMAATQVPEALRIAEVPTDFHTNPATGAYWSQE